MNKPRASKRSHVHPTDPIQDFSPQKEKETKTKRPISISSDSSADSHCEKKFKRSHLSPRSPPIILVPETPEETHLKVVKSRMSTVTLDRAIQDAQGQSDTVSKMLQATYHEDEMHLFERLGVCTHQQCQDWLQTNCHLSGFTLAEGLDSKTQSESDIYFIHPKSQPPTPQFVLKLYESSNLGGINEAIKYHYTTQLYVQNVTRNIMPVFTTCSRLTGEQLLNWIDQQPRTTRSKFAHNMCFVLRESECRQRRKTSKRPSITDQKVCLSSFCPMEERFTLALVRQHNFGYIMTPRCCEDVGTTRTFYNYLNHMILRMDQKVSPVESKIDLKQLEKHFAPWQRDIVQSIFQIVFTIVAFDQVLQLNHNDLHNQNILMDNHFPNETTTAQYVFAPLNPFYISTAYIPRIFDFDRATSQHFNINFPFNNQRYPLAAPFYVPRKDLLFFFCRLLRQLRVAHDNLTRSTTSKALLDNLLITPIKRLLKHPTQLNNVDNILQSGALLRGDCLFDTHVNNPHMDDINSPKFVENMLPDTTSILSGFHQQFPTTFILSKGAQTQPMDTFQLVVDQ